MEQIIFYNSLDTTGVSQATYFEGYMVGRRKLTLTYNGHFGGRKPLFFSPFCLTSNQLIT